MVKRLTVVVFAYACEPGKGSEPEAGWLWSRMLASLFDVYVVTRPNNRDAIDRALMNTPERDHFKFIFVDPPAWIVALKRRIGVRPFYLVWQLSAYRRARRLRDSTPVHLVWHLTFANLWMGSAGAFLGIPFIFGPVGGGPTSPLRLIPSLGLRGASREILR